jgi:asparagine synthase (glutamine-hydrolysing)
LELVKAMAGTLVHRGPDDDGAEFIQHGGVSIGLGFRRLSIIDLSPAGHQPMADPTGRIWILLNGEVYNYADIRKELEALGVSFKSHSDTEVVLQSYLTWGMSMLDRFIGMFAITLLDLRSSSFYLIRDRAGVKPLYYHQSSCGFLFGSELKSFHPHPDFKKEIDPEGLSLYFMNGNIPAPYTIYKNTWKVEPGQVVEIKLTSKSLSKNTYWNIYDHVNKPLGYISYDEALSETERLMRSAFQYRMVSDVPVGVFLSGGYDSTAVTAILAQSVRNLKTFTIGFEESSYDESPFAERVANHLGVNHETHKCTIRDGLDIIPELPFIYDEPFGDSSAIPTTLVSRIARKHVTVALSADAGDELFAGYPRHAKSHRMIRRLQNLPGFLSDGAFHAMKLLPYRELQISKADRLEKFRRILRSKGVMEAFHIINQTYTAKEIRNLMKVQSFFPHTPFQDDDLIGANVEPLNRILALEYKTYLVDDILQKVDRATMSASLEGREPFLDHRLAEWVMRLPVSFKLDKGVSKRMLKDIVHRYVPRELMERPKMGFGVPVQHWMKSELKDLLFEVMSDEALREQEWLDPVKVSELRTDFLEGRLEDFERLWFVFVFLQWYRYWK